MYLLYNIVDCLESNSIGTYFKCVKTYKISFMTYTIIPFEENEVINTSY